MNILWNKTQEWLKKNLLLVILIANSAILLYALLTLEINIKNENFQFQFQSQDQRQWQLQQTVIVNGQIFQQFKLESEAWTAKDCGIEHHAWNSLFGENNEFQLYTCIAKHCKDKPFGCSNVIVDSKNYSFFILYWNVKDK